MKHKFLALLGTLVISLSLVACGGGEKDKTKDAEKLSEAGKLISSSGAEMASAFDNFKSQNPVTGILSADNENGAVNLLNVIKTFRARPYHSCHQVDEPQAP